MSNQLIDAYMNGRRDGMELYELVKFNKLNENIKKSGLLTTYIVNALKNNRFNPIDAYLRINSIARFDVMITIPEEEYLKKEFLEMFDVISEIESSERDELYNVFISFCSVNQYFDEQIVSSDGFVLKLEKI